MHLRLAIADSTNRNAHLASLLVWKYVSHPGDDASSGVPGSSLPSQVGGLGAGVQMGVRGLVGWLCDSGI